MCKFDSVLVQKSTYHWLTYFLEKIDHQKFILFNAFPTAFSYSPQRQCTRQRTTFIGGEKNVLSQTAAAIVLHPPIDEEVPRRH